MPSSRGVLRSKVHRYAVGDGLSEVAVRPRLLARLAVEEDSSASQK